MCTFLLCGRFSVGLPGTPQCVSKLMAAGNSGPDAVLVCAKGGHGTSDTADPAGPQNPDGVATLPGGGPGGLHRDDHP